MSVWTYILNGLFWLLPVWGLLIAGLAARRQMKGADPKKKRSVLWTAGMFWILLAVQPTLMQIPYPDVWLIPEALHLKAAVCVGLPVAMMFVWLLAVYLKYPKKRDATGQEERL